MRDIVEVIFEAYHKAKEAQSAVSVEYKPTSEWKYYIETSRVDYLEALNHNDTRKLKKLLKNFFRNSGSHGIANDYSLSKNKAAKADIGILRDYELWRNITGGGAKDLKQPHVGNPWGHKIDGTLICGSSFKHHRHSFIVTNLLENSETPVIVEIGGGFGGFAYYLLRDRDEITFINFDLPEILLISSYYLLNAFPDRNVLLFNEQYPGALSLDTVKNYDLILLPNFELPGLATNSTDLVFNSSSFSEMDMPTIKEYMIQIERVCKGYLLHENSDVPTQKVGGHVEIPASAFPIPSTFKLIYSKPAVLTANRYKEYLYKKESY